MASINKMNKALYNAAAHIMEAAKYMSNVQEFHAQTATLYKMADQMLEIIKIPDPKVSKEKMDDILKEIMSFGEDKDGTA